MLQVKESVMPSSDQWRIVILGMRNPKNSWDKSDSHYCLYWNKNEYGEDCEKCTYNTGKTINRCLSKDTFSNPGYVIEKKDLKLMEILCKSGNPELQRLKELSQKKLDPTEDSEFLELIEKAIKGSPEHSKFMRQLPVTLNIRAPLYWWKQMDQYKVGTVTDSCSTMHKLTDKEFEKSDFSIEHLQYADEPQGLGTYTDFFVSIYIKLLNHLRDRYLETKDPNAWYALNEFLSQSYMQTRTWSGSYENLRTICRQRAGHKLYEWEQFINWVRENVPFAKQLIFNEWQN